MVPPMMGSHDDVIRTPESCSWTVGKAVRYCMRALGGSESLIRAAGNKSGSRLVGDGNWRLTVVVTHIWPFVCTWA
jgi:hypothetical protein